MSLFKQGRYSGYLRPISYLIDLSIINGLAILYYFKNIDPVVFSKYLTGNELTDALLLNKRIRAGAKPNETTQSPGSIRGNSNNKDSIVINLDHKLKYSQWIAAVVICEDSAVAHTTPVYVVVDGKPTYDVDKGPAIIEKQIVSIQNLIKQDSSVPPVDQGLIERYNTAIKFYQMLLSEMKKDKQERNKK